jgi:hypothetical protein
MPTTTGGSYYADGSTALSLATIFAAMADAESARSPYYWLSQAQQDAQTGMVAGEFGLQANNGITYQYSGSAWQAWSSDWIAFTPTLTNIAIGTGGGAENTAYYRYANGSGEVKGIIKLGTSGASVGTLPTLTLPSGWAAVKPFETAIVCGSLSILDSSTPSTASGQIGFVSGSTSTIRFLRQPDSLGVIQPITASSPFTFASGDIFAYRYTVELS